MGFQRFLKLLADFFREEFFVGIFSGKCAIIKPTYIEGGHRYEKMGLRRMRMDL